MGSPHGLKALTEIKQLAASLDVKKKQAIHDAIASAMAKRLGRKPRAALMESLREKFRIEDKSIPMPHRHAHSGQGPHFSLLS